MTTQNWLTPELRQKVRETFEPKYKRVLSEDEVEEIANNLSGFVETCLKFEWRKRERNGKKIKGLT